MMDIIRRIPREDLPIKKIDITKGVMENISATPFEFNLLTNRKKIVQRTKKYPGIFLLKFS